MKDKKGIIIGIIVIFLIFTSLYFDSQIVKAVSEIRNESLDKFFIWITLASSEIVIFFVLTTFFIWKEKKRRWIAPLWLSLGTSAVISFMLKITIQRQRPYQLNLVSLLSSLQEASHSIWNFSFPSSHAMIAFSAIPIISEQFPKLKYIWIGFAILICFSRLYFGLHFLSDVLAGALIGYILGMIFVYLEKDSKFGEKIYNKILRR
ncbi:MAG: phosphatase PAP2 family protein [Candidatus Pacearchaeota archaeon]|nr:phosphatase PAP2 family protein [Candidatus Pacearchaeota archaeon]